MAKLFRIRWFYILLFTSVYLLSAPPAGTTVLMIRAANQGSIFLDTKEQQVKQIAAAALENHRKCELVSSCERECSRATCVPLSDDRATCAKVNNNKECTASDGNTCKDMMLNYNKSYVTLPKGADAKNLRPEVRRDFCLQRGLNTTFRGIYNQSQYSYMYYGSTSGAWRAYPGRESSEKFCTSYECRQRPWYLDGISVQKQVRILIDTGASMGAPVTGAYGRESGATLLQVAINISLSIIQTLSPQDFVDVISFNSTGAYSLVTTPVHVGNYNQSVDGDVVNSELEPLKSNVRSLNPSNDPQNSNLTKAIVEGISTFQNTTPPSLKIVVVISDGNFLPLDGITFPTAAITAHRAKLLMYKLPSNAIEDPYLEQTTLRSVLCGVQGSFEMLDAPSTVNPLYAIRSYFSYLAKVHMRAANETSSWSTVYKSINQALDASTVTFPAIDIDGELIGVAAIDVFVNELEPTLREEVKNELANITRSRKIGNLPAPSTLPPETCNYKIGLTGQFCSNFTAPADGIICQRSDERTLKERVCCESCAIKINNGPAPSPSPASGSSDSSDRWRIPVGATVGALLLVVVAAVVIGALVSKREHRERVVACCRQLGCCWGRDIGPTDPINTPPPADEVAGGSSMSTPPSAEPFAGGSTANVPLAAEPVAGGSTVNNPPAAELVAGGSTMDTPPPAELVVVGSTLNTPPTQ